MKKMIFALFVLLCLGAMSVTRSANAGALGEFLGKQTCACVG